MQGEPSGAKITRKGKMEGMGGVDSTFRPGNLDAKSAWEFFNKEGGMCFIHVYFPVHVTGIWFEGLLGLGSWVLIKIFLFSIEYTKIIINK